MKATIYFKEGFWCVDYIDDNAELLPSVGMFTELEEANQSALIWVKGDKEHVALVGQGSW